MEEKISFGRINIGYHGTLELLAEMLRQEQAKVLIKVILEDYIDSGGEHILDVFLARRCAQGAGFKKGDDKYLDGYIFHYGYSQKEDKEISDNLIDFLRNYDEE